MTEIISFSKIHLAGVIDVILPIQREEFDLPASFPVMVVDTKFYKQIVSRAAADFWK